MVVGVHVTRPSPGSGSNAPSIAGMVASVDRRLGQWPADLRIKESRKEMVSELGSMVKSHLHLFKSQGKHTTFPETYSSTAMASPKDSMQRSLRSSSRCYAGLAMSYIHLRIGRRVSRTSPSSSSVSATTPISILRLPTTPTPVAIPSVGQ